jgi:hypothetical protein
MRPSQNRQKSRLPELDIDLRDPFQSGVRDILQCRAPGEGHGQLKFRQHVLNHLPNTLFPGDGQTIDVWTPEADRRGSKRKRFAHIGGQDLWVASQEASCPALGQGLGNYRPPPGEES